MPTLYLDTSVLGRVLLGEPDRAAILRALAPFEQRVSSRLLAVELRRLALRAGQEDAAEHQLRAVALIAVSDQVLGMAETILPVTVATLDAIHLATALTLMQAGTLDALMTYDARLAAGAEHHGMTVIAPA